MQLMGAALVVACSSGTAPATPPPGTPSPAASATATAGASVTATATSSPIVRYVAIGASDTVGVGALDPERGSWPSRLAALLPAGSAYVNVGVSGSLTAQARAEQLPRAIRERPTLVTVWLAVNDMNAAVTPEAHASELASIIDALVAGTAARVFVGNVPDLRAVPAYADADHEVLGALVAAYNDGIARVGRRHGDRVVLVDLFTGSAELMTGVTVATDGFHPSDAGYVLIAGRFAAAMRDAGVPLRD